MSRLGMFGDILQGFAGNPVDHFLDLSGKSGDTGEIRRRTPAGLCLAKRAANWRRAALQAEALQHCGAERGDDRGAIRPRCARR